MDHTEHLRLDLLHSAPIGFYSLDQRYLLAPFAAHDLFDVDQIIADLHAIQTSFKSHIEGKVSAVHQSASYAVVRNWVWLVGDEVYLF